ncbi:MAG TPA: right-handed parallel beta-helix repeat-containing protein [Gemmatimonadaceae bacterium]|nr:right-handed parallel beta-helix repeat-containing protein [Gemmatimonadaceae bacterium]
MMKLLALAAVFIPLHRTHAQPPAPRHAVLAVPAKFPSIQAAIDSAVPGDTVLVAPGRYYENIRYKGKGIVVASQFSRTRNAADIERTIIDGSRPAHPDTGTVVRFTNQEDSTAVLEGFTITGGTGTIWLDAKDLLYFREGGGILCELGSPTIRYNHIVNNMATSTSKNVKGDSLRSAGGGAIRCGYSEPTITNNVIRGNKGRYGGGIVLFHSAGIVKNNLIADNTGGEDFGGAGLWIVGPLSYRLTTLVEHNTIVNNKSTTADASNPRAMKGRGGALIAAGTKVVFRNNIVWGNSQTAGNQVSYAPNTPPEMINNLVQGGAPGTGNLDADPKFAETTRFTLSVDSPARRAGVELGAYGGVRH